MGASKFAWTDGGAQTFTTDLHVQSQVPNINQPVFPSQSLDGTVIEVLSVGTGQEEVWVTVTHERDDEGLRDWRDAIVRGISQVFTPDIDAPGTTFTVTAIHPIPQISMISEGQQSPRYSMTGIRLRRLDGGAFLP